MIYDSSPVFTFEPEWGVAQTVKDNWTTIVAASESGKEQRRNRWSRPQGSFSLQFDLHYPKVKDELLSFYTARKGAYEKFWLPSFRRDSRLTAPYNSAGAVFYVDNVTPFSATLGARGNDLIIRTLRNDAMFTGRVLSIVEGTKMITLISGGGSTIFPVGSSVEPLYLARFDSDTLDEAIRIYSVTASIEFKEVW
jgi:hypothetical protein